MKPDAFGKCIFNVSAYIPSFRMPSCKQHDRQIFVKTTQMSSFTIACVASVPVRQKSFETIFCKLAARKLGKRLRERLQEDPLFLKNPFAHERGLLIGAAQSQ